MLRIRARARSTDGVTAGNCAGIMHFHREALAHTMALIPTTILTGFLGAGKLAGSVIRGLVRSNFCKASDIIAGEPNEDARKSLQGSVGIDVTADNSEVAQQSETLFIGVKPSVVLPVLRDVSSAASGKRR